ncbi:hypothetical protein RHSIM_RhsimUnG0195100 [Rhododendron simsii]|uniref:EF-hand domain-containing protein n=1 Tax=Rhododendron simsii TaxID=118357 RepID=A0A834FTK9_RHOSS|nr:hypothetical protein RHSIM_RhsimUnG0195100 [Rhododendron simsii]
MRQEGHEKMSSRDFFKTLDKKRRGTLGFAEVPALFYIIQSGRPFCHGCDVFIAGMYFTCSKCHESDSNDVIFLCPDCFENGSHTHRHKRNQFLDNYALLALKEKRGIARAGSHSIQQRQPTSSEVAASTTNAIVPYAPPHDGGEHKWKPAFQAMKLAVATASLGSNCVANFCTIMELAKRAARGSLTAELNGRGESRMQQAAEKPLLRRFIERRLSKLVVDLY